MYHQHYTVANFGNFQGHFFGYFLAKYFGKNILGFLKASLGIFGRNIWRNHLILV